MRRLFLASLAASSLILAACGDDGASQSTPTTATTTPAGSSAATTVPEITSAPASTCAEGKTITDGTLTIATGEPAFPPYVVDNDPTNKQGFEAAVAWAIAGEMGFADDAVTWVRTTFDEAIQPGAKNFDFNLQQFTITPERAETISFSLPYFTSNQAVVALNGSAGDGVTSIDDLKKLKFGVQTGTTSLDFVNDVIQPDQEVFVYDDNVGVKAAMEANQIDAAVFDLATALYVSNVEIDNSSVVAQFPRSAGGSAEQFGLVLEKDSPLIDCVDEAITAIRDSGELDAITDEWMETGDVAPVIQVG
jgi:polar amino acid transport system substrate-binding protein